MIEKAPPPANPAEQTRAALLHAALRLFGRQGFDGTSTREIAAAAKANIGSIAYHFGGKEGLRMAAADHIVTTIQAIAARALGAPEQGGGLPTQDTAPRRRTPAAPGMLTPDMALEQPTPAAPAGPTPEGARRQLGAAIEQMVGFVVATPEAGEIVQFVLRELAHPTAALDRIYTGVFEPSHRRLCALWAAATGEEPDSEEVRLTVFTLIGQIVYFRIGREAVMRRMGWNAIGPAEAAKVAATARANMEAMLAARRGAGS